MRPIALQEGLEYGKQPNDIVKLSRTSRSANGGRKSLVERSLSDPEAYAELNQRHVGPIYRFHLVRTGSIDEAQDLTSQTFLAAFNGIKSFSGHGSFCG